MKKVKEAAIEKNQQIIGLKARIFRVHYITMYFTDIKFPYMEPGERKRLHFLDSKTKHFNRHHDCHATWIRIIDKTQKDD